MALDRNAILSADDIKTETIAVPEWGGEVIVKALSAVEFDSWEAWCTEQRRLWTSRIGPNVRASLVVRCAVNEKGDRLFGDGEVELLGAKNGKAVDRLFDAAMRLSGLTEERIEELKKT